MQELAKAQIQEIQEQKQLRADVSSMQKSFPDLVKRLQGQRRKTLGLLCQRRGCAILQGDPAGPPVSPPCPRLVPSPLGRRLLSPQHPGPLNLAPGTRPGEGRCCQPGRHST